MLYIGMLHHAVITTVQVSNTYTRHTPATVLACSAETTIHMHFQSEKHFTQRILRLHCAMQSNQGCAAAATVDIAVCPACVGVTDALIKV